MTRVLAMISLAMTIGVILILVGRPRANDALACTGGGSGLEDAAARAQWIILGDAVEVGDAINRAPTVVPTSTPIAASRTEPPPSTPPSPPVAPPRRIPTPEGFTLAGYGVALRAERVYVAAMANPSAPLRVDDGVRASIESEIRDLESGRGISNCGLGRYTFRFEQGSRYLLFAIDDGSGFGLYTLYRFKVVGTDVLLHDPLVTTYDPSAIYVSDATYGRFFSRFSAERLEGNPTLVRMTADRLPLAVVLSAVSAIRGDPSIAPPDTGSAGLVSGRW